MCIFRCWHEHQNTQVSDSLRAQWRKWRHWSVWRASWRDLIQTEPGSTHQNVSLRLLWASHLLWYLYHMERCPGLLVEKVWGSKECVTSSMSVCSVLSAPSPPVAEGYLGLTTSRLSNMFSRYDLQQFRAEAMNGTKYWSLLRWTVTYRTGLVCIQLCDLNPHRCHGDLKGTERRHEENEGFALLLTDKGRKKRVQHILNIHFTQDAVCVCVWGWFQIKDMCLGYQ